MRTIMLTPGKPCKCSCRNHKGDDGKEYWYHLKEKIVYSTDCHKPNPIKAIGKFKIGDKIFDQS